MDREHIKAKLYDYFCKMAGIVSYTSYRDDETSDEFVKRMTVLPTVRSCPTDLSSL